MDRKEQIKTIIAGTIVVLLILTAVVVAYKYNVEGENETMPFKISKIIIGSTVASKDKAEVNTENEIVQNNGVYIEVTKNEGFEKDATIKEIQISNITVTKKPTKGEVKYYMPNTKVNEKFTYSDEYILESNSLTYRGASKSNTTTLEVNNQGGIIAIAFANTGLGTYQITADGIKVDGTLLNTMGITDEDIKFSVKFDLIISTEGKKYKTIVYLDLPISEITTNGTASLEITDTSNYIFKRVNN